MKTLYSLLTLLALPPLAYSDIVISGLDFTKQKSIQRTLDGINTFRSSQNVILHLSQTETIKIVDAFSNHRDISFAFISVGKGGSVRLNGSEHVEKEQFLEWIKIFGLRSRGSGSNAPLIVSFDKDVSGTEGLAMLKILSSHNIQIVMVRLKDDTKSKAPPLDHLHQELRVPSHPNKLPLHNKTLHPTSDRGSAS